MLFACLFLSSVALWCQASFKCKRNIGLEESGQKMMGFQGSQTHFREIAARLIFKPLSQCACGERISEGLGKGRHMITVHQCVYQRQPHQQPEFFLVSSGLRSIVDIVALKG